MLSLQRQRTPKRTNILLAERIYELEAAADHKALREMELFKAELLATVSHELRSPLASVKGYAATLLRHERRISREERHEFLLAIKEASDRLEAVIDRLLEISQLETAGITIQRSIWPCFDYTTKAPHITDPLLCDTAVRYVLLPVMWP